MLLHTSPSASASPLIHQPTKSRHNHHPTYKSLPPAPQSKQCTQIPPNHLPLPRENQMGSTSPSASTSPQKAKTLDVPKPKANPDPESQPIPAACFLVVHQCWLILMMCAAHSLYWPGDEFVFWVGLPAMLVFRFVTVVVSMCVCTGLVEMPVFQLNRRNRDGEGGERL